MINELETRDIHQANSLILNLYDESLPLHTRLVNFLNSLKSLIYSDHSTILFFFKDENDIYHKHSSISINFDPEKSMVKQYDEYYCQYDDTLPVFDQEESIVFRSSSFFNQEKRLKNKYWTEYLIPSNCIYSLEGNILIDSETYRCAFNLYRGEEKTDFTEKDVELMTLFQPHLANLLRNFGNEPDNTSMFFMLDNHGCVGFATLDSRYRTINCNNTYKDLLSYERTDEYGDKDSGFVSAKIVSLCAELAKDTSENATIEYKFQDAPIYIVVSKIPDEKGDAKGRYSCMIYDLSYFYNKTLDHTKENFSLTSREFEILKEVLNGKSNEEIAAEKFLALPTVKKCLASVYNKMDIQNQKQILSKLKISK